MAEEQAGGVTIIKRIKKAAHGHHGGAWKVAYADFVTAMMAFFLLLWLLNAVTEVQLKGISNYFAPTAASESPSGAGGMLGGQVIGVGASQSNSGTPVVAIDLPPSTIGQGGSDFTDAKDGRAEQDKDGKAEKDGQGPQDKASAAQQAQITASLRQALNASPELSQLQGNLLVDNTPEGIRIQVLDTQGHPMFPPNSSAMYERTQQLLLLVGKTIRDLPQKIAIDGHTIAAGTVDANGYGNWELSADRALNARRVLLQSGLTDSKIARVSGRAGTDPLSPKDPNDVRNHRITIVLLRPAEEQGVRSGPLDAPPLSSVIAAPKP